MPVTLFFRDKLRKEEAAALAIKQRELFNSHPDRLDGFCENNKAAVLEYLKNAQTKGYNILPAYNPRDKMHGFIVYKEIDGTELAYNPLYPESEGIIEEFKNGYLSKDNPYVLPVLGNTHSE